MRVDDVCWIKEMVWSESNARKLQINQLGKSACGATSVVNTLVSVLLVSHKFDSFYELMFFFFYLLFILLPTPICVLKFKLYWTLKALSITISTIHKS